MAAPEGPIIEESGSSGDARSAKSREADRACENLQATEQRKKIASVLSSAMASRGPCEPQMGLPKRFAILERIRVNLRAN